MNTQKNLFELLRNKKILSILDGDEKFGEFSDENVDHPIEISMPYLSGPAICEISELFGLSANYSWGGGAKSRWMYLDDLIAHCIKNDRVYDLLSYLFSTNQFSNKLEGCSSEVVEKAHSVIVETTIKQINGILYFGGNELVQVSSNFYIRKIGTKVTVDAPKIKVIDRKYISELSERALKNVSDGYYDSAVTQARTLLEEVFCYVIEKKNETPSGKGDINKLYKQVKDLYNMHEDSNMDKRVNMLLSGLEKIVNSIAEARNTVSDAHGVGAKRINIADHHARLFVNSATTMADFILSVTEKQLGKPKA